MPSTLSSPKAPCEKANGWNNSHGRGPQDSAMKSLASSSGSFALSILKQIGIIGSIRLANGLLMASKCFKSCFARLPDHQTIPDCSKAHIFDFRSQDISIHMHCHNLRNSLLFHVLTRGRAVRSAEGCPGQVSSDRALQCIAYALHILHSES